MSSVENIFEGADMNGTHHVRISNSSVRFDLDLKRNITVVRGNSGTGKTTLYELVAEHMRLGEKSGVNISCDVHCVALTDMDWKNQLNAVKASIVFIDEGADYVSGEEFAAAIRASDNYYVILVRENLYLLPYSVKEIYEIKMSGKYHKLVPMYKERAGCVYGAAGWNKKADGATVLTEDSGAGHQFFKTYVEGTDIKCETAAGNSSIYKWLDQHKTDKVVVVADGAAFGAEMDRVMKFQSQYPDNIRVCLPESFEWMILNSGLIKGDDIDEVMADPSDHVDSSKYFSWEQFFFHYLVQSTENTPFRYSKRKINEIYLVKNNSARIIAAISLGL